jgi:IclR family pca regulon transcriptional regulator
VLLAALSDDRLDTFFGMGPLTSMTDRTICSESKLRDALAEVRARGWAWNDGESEDGIRSVAAPILDRGGRVHAAINVAGLASRVSIKELRSRFVPVVVEAGVAISRALGADPQRLQRRILDHDFRLSHQ